MTISAKHVLVVVVAIALCGLAWQLVMERRSAGAVWPTNEQGEEENPSGSNGSSLVPPLPDEDREARAPDPVTPPDTPPATFAQEVEQPWRTPTPDAVFEAQYRWLSDASEAESLADKCKEDLKSAKKEQYRFRYASGQYDVHPFEFTPDGERKPFKPKGRSLGFSQLIPDETRGEWHVVRLPESKYPELYRMFDERQWLLRRSRELAKTNPH